MPRFTSIGNTVIELRESKKKKKVKKKHMNKMAIMVLFNGNNLNSVQFSHT